MLKISATTNYAGVTIAGDHSDFETSYDSLHEIVVTKVSIQVMMVRRHECLEFAMIFVMRWWVTEKFYL